MQIEIDHIPLPTVVYEAEPEVALLNTAYEERFGPGLCPDHLRLLQSRSRMRRSSGKCIGSKIRMKEFQSGCVKRIGRTQRSFQESRVEWRI